MPKTSKWSHSQRCQNMSKTQITVLQLFFNCSSVSSSVSWPRTSLSALSARMGRVQARSSQPSFPNTFGSQNFAINDTWSRKKQVAIKRLWSKCSTFTKDTKPLRIKTLRISLDIIRCQWIRPWLEQLYWTIAIIYCNHCSILQYYFSHYILPDRPVASKLLFLGASEVTEFHLRRFTPGLHVPSTVLPISSMSPYVSSVFLNSGSSAFTSSEGWCNIPDTGVTMTWK